MKHSFSFIVAFSLLIGSILSYSSLSHSAYGDGLFQEHLSASFGDRTANLLIKMSPPVVTTETLQNQTQKPEIQFRFYDPATDENFKEVTYFITIEKDGKRLLSNWFFNPDGNLTIQMQPRNQNQISVYGELDPILNAYTSRGNTPVVAAGPIFVEGGLYHFNVRIVTVDFSRTILPDDQQPEFDGWLSVGAVKNADLNVNGEEIPVRVISYYDELENVTYDQSANSINLTMPFDYDLERLNDPENNVFIHQEVDIPKGSVLATQGAYQGYVNGRDITNVLTVDGNDPQKDIIHFLIGKTVVQQIANDYVNNTNKAENVNNEEGLMTFSIIPTQNGSKSLSGNLVCVPGLEFCY